MAAKQPVAIVFDTFGTVVDWRGSLIAELTEFGRERGITADWTALVDAWRGLYHPSMQRVRTGEMPWTKLDALHRMALDRLVAELGIKGLSEADLRHINLGWHRLHGWPDSVPGLTRLKRRFIIGPLSNGNVALLTNMAKFAGLPWDMVFGSDLFGHFKPDPETYLGVAKLLDLEPGQVMMAAAHNGDLAECAQDRADDGVLPAPQRIRPAPETRLRGGARVGCRGDGYRGPGGEAWMLKRATARSS